MDEHNERAVAAGTADGSRIAQLGGELQENKVQATPAQAVVSVRVRVNGKIQHFVGRFAWTLALLIEAGPAGFSSFDVHAPRLAHYIHILRRRGLIIATVHERHGGRFPGHHARYELRSRVEILEAA